MVITSARLQNYRSYTDSSFEFESHVNIIVGPNASGKTNLLDALYYAATGGSMKPSSEHVVRHEQSWARIDCMTSENQTRTVKIKQSPTGLQKELLLDDKLYRRLPKDRMLPVVLFEPNHLYFITTSPDMRRQLIDGILEKSQEGFITLKNKYVRTLRQRNALLKQPLDQVRSQIFAWDVRISELAGQYTEERLKLLRKINETSSEIYTSIAGNQHSLLLTYESKISATNYASNLLTKLQARLELDHQRGFTGYGPHRDDIGLLIDDKDMRDVASRGETRSILLTLKVTEAQILEEVHQQKPILLLDDVFGELDGSRRKSLISFMQGSQTFITTTDADVVNDHLGKNSYLISTS